MKNKIDELFFKVMVFFPDKIFEYIFAHIWQPLFWNVKLKFENEGILLFENDTFYNKMSFIDVCEKKNLYWPDEMDKIHKELGLN